MNRRVRIFLDANIVFSAAKKDGAVQSLVARLLDATHECWVDAYVIDEARRNLLAKAPERLPHCEQLLSRLRVASHVPAMLGAQVAGLPEKDRVVLAAAAALACDILVTGDRTHFGKLYGRVIAGVQIHSPRSLYDQLFPLS